MNVFSSLESVRRFASSIVRFVRPFDTRAIFSVFRAERAYNLVELCSTKLLKEVILLLIENKFPLRPASHVLPTRRQLPAATNILRIPTRRKPFENVVLTRLTLLDENYSPLRPRSCTTAASNR
jgi:hypothetical protein